MKKIFLAIIIILWIIFSVCFRDFTKNYQDESEEFFETDYEYVNGDYYDNYK